MMFDVTLNIVDYAGCHMLFVLYFASEIDSLHCCTQV